MTAFIGVDEAGRGPVLGSLFVGAVSVADRADLPSGVDDSKALAAAERCRLATRLDDDPAVATAVIELEVSAIDGHQRSLTEHVAAAFADAIERLADPGDEVFVDAGEADEARFAGRVHRYLETDVGLVARIRADATDPLVGAASIVAKEAREAHVAALTERFGEIGSGYPSDPTTRQFLATYVADNGELPDCARRSWSTSRDVVAAADQSGLDEFVSTDRE